jgi:ubiquinone/menaquinone biosynthesis C-methylase UbiE
VQLLGNAQTMIGPRSRFADHLRPSRATRISRLNDPEYVAAEYADESGLLARAELWRACTGPQPQDVALAHVREMGPRAVLEVGCGPGVFAAALQDSGSDVTAVDQSERMVALTTARGVRARRADVQQLPFADGSFDLVVANYVLYHVADLPRALRQIARVLRPGGALVAVTNSLRKLGELWDLVGVDRGDSAEVAFNSENGAGVLAPYFGGVERIDIEERFRVTEATLRAYLRSTRFAALADNVPDLPDGLSVTAAGSVFIATK